MTELANEGIDLEALSGILQGSLAGGHQIFAVVSKFC